MDWRPKCKARNYKGSLCLGTMSRNYVFLEEDIGKTLSHINHSRILYDPPPRVMEIKSEINKWDLIKKLLHNEGNYKQGENTAFRMGGK